MKRFCKSNEGPDIQVIRIGPDESVELPPEIRAELERVVRGMFGDGVILGEPRLIRVPEEPKSGNVLENIQTDGKTFVCAHALLFLSGWSHTIAHGPWP